MVGPVFKTVTRISLILFHSVTEQGHYWKGCRPGSWSQC